jgi:hypothetical protein
MQSLWNVFVWQTYGPRCVTLNLFFASGVRTVNTLSILHFGELHSVQQYACRTISHSFVDRYKYTGFGQPTAVRGWKGTDGE